MSVATKHGGSALVVALLVVSSTLALSVAPATAAVQSDFEVTTDATQSGGNITVDGNLSAAGTDDVTFLIQDPADGDVATVTRSVDQDFTETINLSKQSFKGGDGDLDEGTATVLVEEASSFTSAEQSDTFVVDDTLPSATIDDPGNNADLQSQPTISGTASDDTAVDTVDVVIKRQNDSKYYDGSSFVSSKQRIAASGTNDWSYNTTANGISADGTYEISLVVNDTANNTRETVVPQPDGSTTDISYTVDSTDPSINQISVTDESDGDGTVVTGDTVDITANVTDATSGVDTVTVDATALGGSETEALALDNGSNYTTSLQVDDPEAGDGTLDMTVTATDGFGNSRESTATDAITLETSADDVDSLSIEHDFVGIVRDDDTDVTVTASGITDPRGKTISGPTTVDIEIAGETVGTGTVTDGSFETTINTVTNLSNDTATGDATVEIAGTGSDAAVTTVELVHEAQGLEEGFQVQSTPMPLDRDPVFESVDQAITYDPTVGPNSTEWVTPDIQQAGAGYYVEGASDAARIGYVFDTDASTGVDARTLHEGFNLVGASHDLAGTTSKQVSDDLGGAVSVDGNSNVEAWVRDSTVELDTSVNTSAYNEVDGTKAVTAYTAYFVYIENSEEYRNVEIEPYEPGNRTG